jgi:hypothetical protein
MAGYATVIRFSLTSLIVFVYEFYSGPLIGERFLVTILAFLISNSVSDYLSLFVIRRWSIIGGKRPLFAILTAPLIGAVVVKAVMICSFFVAGIIIITHNLGNIIGHNFDNIMEFIKHYPQLMEQWWIQICFGHEC